MGVRVLLAVAKASFYLPACCCLSGLSRSRVRDRVGGTVRLVDLRTVTLPSEYSTCEG
jgi:hypothetical protein